MKLLLLSLLLAVPCYAGKNAELKPTLAKAGKVLTEQNFDTGGLDKPWTVAKGDWQVAGGAVVGKEKAEDKHPAVLALALPSKDSIMQLSFKLDGAKMLALSYNHAAGHLFRVVITGDGFTINKDPDKNDPSIKGGVLGKAEAKFDKGQWYTILVEVKGEKVAVQADNGAKAEGADPRLAMDKINYRFVTQGESVQLDDLKITEAQ
ncbi:MAG TPA: hypothetical protein VGO11_08735 [Chthoniobacteraceae bacterium]|jgi:hypothetical protein|nr:hypothetical protein [Chthoniobacteraceae bacterium]